MGQKTSSIALRLGLHRKWSTSWFSPDFTSSGASPSLSSSSLTAASVFNSASSSFTRLAPHVVPRGGQLRSGREDRLFSLFCRRPFVFSSSTNTPNSAATFPRFVSVASQHSFVGDSTSSYEASRSRSSIRRRPSSLSAPLTSPHRFYPIDLHVRVGSGGQLFIFFVYAKLLGRSKGALFI